MIAETNYQQSVDYQRIEEAILYLDKHFHQQPSLADIAASVGVSPYHFQRLFSRWAGISPKRFLQYLTLTYAKELLSHSKSILETTYSAGLSSPGRLHDLFVTYEALTPGQFKQKGQGLTIQYGFQPTPFGDCLLASTQRGICGLSFVPPDGRAKALAELQATWPLAQFQADQTGTQSLASHIFTPFATEPTTATPLTLFLQGTNFQIKVWLALLQIPKGLVASYGDVATMIEQPKSARAIGQVAGKNPIGFLIPCHRVIRKIGTIGGYRWGTPRKKAMLAWEAAQQRPLSFA